MPVELVGMIGVRPEGTDGAAGHVIGGEIDLGRVRGLSRAREEVGFERPSRRAMSSSDRRSE